MGEEGLFCEDPTETDNAGLQWNGRGAGRGASTHELLPVKNGFSVNIEI